MRPALIVTATLLLFGACFGGETSPRRAAPAQIATPERPLATFAPTRATPPAANAATPTATPTAGAARFDKPPAAIARAGAASVAMGLGSYCWTSGSAGLCVDAAGVIPGTAALRVGRGEAVAIGGELAQTEFAVGRARIRPVEGGPAYEGKDWLTWMPAARDWPGEWSALDLSTGDGGIRFTAGPAGRYLVDLSLSFAQGDAHYGLILAVQ